MTDACPTSAGCYPYGEDRDETDSDIPLFCAYIATAKELLQDPTVETEGSPAHLKLVELIMALRKYAAHVRLHLPLMHLHHRPKT